MVGGRAQTRTSCSRSRGKGDPAVEVELAGWRVHLGQSVQVSARLLICLSFIAFSQNRNALRHSWSPSLSREARSHLDLSSGKVPGKEAVSREGMG